ncbi:MAG: NAD(P)-dependent oxidoreductase [Desulfuromonadales bacterium]|nr:NAD(P)-dependent oxidoreductase [Desulfuromonadales bacterium]MDT8423113.1 NAD(P)-dependent oxidoreductase [Desulfuromonadales bacterium]
MAESLQDKVLFITGASRGIGRAIALRAAREKACIVVAAKSIDDNPQLPGNIHSVAAEIEALGGKALPLALDIRDEDRIEAAVAAAVRHFGGIDILINNASAISLTPTPATAMKKFDLMFNVNVRGTFACSRACLPHLRHGRNPHILNLSPPLNMEAHWFQNHCAYTMSKYGMSMCVLGMAEEFRPSGIAVNALWPRTVIATAALAMLGDLVKKENCRTPEIVADAAQAILTRPGLKCSGNFFIDEEVLREEGATDFARYAVNPEKPLLPDLFLEGAPGISL